MAGNSDSDIGNSDDIPPDDEDPVEEDERDSDFVEMDPTGRYGRYEEVLGKGAFKTVYRAFDEVEGIEVAWNQVKVQELFRSQAELERLYAEVHLLKTLRHKNIIKFYNSWVDTKTKNVNFITEIFTSGTLRQYRKKHKHCDMKAVKNWSRQILRGLLYLHSHDPPIIHRDLKCDNIFVNGNQGEVKIGDLGLAAILRHKDAAHSVIGTPEYMAPELYEEEYNELVDIYAFGMCVLEMITLEYPYSECTNAAQIYKKVSAGKKPAALEKVKDAEVKAFVEKCLASASRRLPARDLLNHPFLREDNPNVNSSGNLFTMEGLPMSRAESRSEDLEKMSYSAFRHDSLQKNHHQSHEDMKKGSSNDYSLGKAIRQDSDASIPENGDDDTSKAISNVKHSEDEDGPRGARAFDKLQSPQSPNARLEQTRSSRDFKVKGRRIDDDSENLFLRLRIRDYDGQVRNIHFPFNINNDTAFAVASEMVEELALSDQDVSNIAEMIDAEIMSIVPEWKPGFSSDNESESGEREDEFDASLQFDDKDSFVDSPGKGMNADFQGSNHHKSNHSGKFALQRDHSYDASLGREEDEVEVGSGGKSSSVNSSDLASSRDRSLSPTKSRSRSRSKPLAVTSSRSGVLSPTFSSNLSSMILQSAGVTPAIIGSPLDSHSPLIGCNPLTGSPPKVVLHGRFWERTMSEDAPDICAVGFSSDDSDSGGNNRTLSTVKEDGNEVDSCGESMSRSSSRHMDERDGTMENLTLACDPGKSATRDLGGESYGSILRAKFKGEMQYDPNEDKSMPSIRPDLFGKSRVEEEIEAGYFPDDGEGVGDLHDGAAKPRAKERDDSAFTRSKKTPRGFGDGPTSGLEAAGERSSALPFGPYATPMPPLHPEGGGSGYVPHFDAYTNPYSQLSSPFLTPFSAFYHGFSSPPNRYLERRRFHDALGDLEEGQEVGSVGFSDSEIESLRREEERLVADRAMELQQVDMKYKTKLVELRSKYRLRVKSRETGSVGGASSASKKGEVENQRGFEISTGSKGGKRGGAKSSAPVKNDLLYNSAGNFGLETSLGESMQPGVSTEVVSSRQQSDREVTDTSLSLSPTTHKLTPSKSESAELIAASSSVAAASSVAAGTSISESRSAGEINSAGANPRRASEGSDPLKFVTSSAGHPSVAPARSPSEQSLETRINTKRKEGGSQRPGATALGSPDRSPDNPDMECKGKVAASPSRSSVAPDAAALPLVMPHRAADLAGSAFSHSSSYSPHTSSSSNAGPAPAYRKSPPLPHSADSNTLAPSALPLAAPPTSSAPAGASLRAAAPSPGPGPGSKPGEEVGGRTSNVTAYTSAAAPANSMPSVSAVVKRDSFPEVHKYSPGAGSGGVPPSSSQTHPVGKLPSVGSSGAAAASLSPAVVSGVSQEQLKKEMLQKSIAEMEARMLQGLPSTKNSKNGYLSNAGNTNISQPLKKAVGGSTGTPGGGSTGQHRS